LKLKSPRLLFAFLKVSGECIQHAQNDSACLAGATYFGPGFTFWTATLWNDLEASRNYVRTGAHLEAMPKLAVWCSEAATTNFQADVLPSKAEILNRLLEAGPKFFKVQNPSATHTKNQISPRSPWLVQVFKSEQR